MTPDMPMALRDGMGPWLGVVIGIGLAAAAGFRVFVPFLVVALAARAQLVPLSPGFDWVASTPALAAFATATFLEVLAYSIPWVDHALDIVATPAALVAGVLASAAVMTDLPPVLKWSIALIAGGGTAGVVQGATVLARLKSAVTTAGAANPLVAGAEFLGSIATALFAIFLPVLGLALVITLCAILFRKSRRFVFGRRG